MALGLSTSGTLFGIKAAEDTIRRNQNSGGQGFTYSKVEYVKAMATLLSATSGGYRVPPDIIRFMGDTGTHEVGHVMQAEQTLMRYRAVPPSGYLWITLENCFMTLLGATSTGYRPSAQVLGYAIEIGGVSAGW